MFLNNLISHPRVGIGYDVHRLSSGYKLILGGVLIPHDKGLVGHSDADVLIHAIIDALLGAASKGDIGELFPDTDPKYKGIDSSQLLKEVLCIIEDFEILHIDATIIAQAPKLTPYKNEIKENLAKILNLSTSKINIKATTEEYLGFTGSYEGIKAVAVCTIE